MEFPYITIITSVPVGAKEAATVPELCFIHLRWVETLLFSAGWRSTNQNDAHFYRAAWNADAV